MPDAGLEELIASVALAREALAEITPETTIGEPAGHVVEADGVVSLLFESRLPGYPGWRWTVTIGRADDDAEPTVLEAELMPGDTALLAPDWVPWSERLAEYQAAQEALAAEAAASGEGEAAEEEVESEEDLEDEDDSDEEGVDELDEDEDEDEDELDEDDLDEDDLDEDDDDDIHDLHGDDDLDGVDIDSVDLEGVDAAYDEETDVDPELDLASEEAAALDPSAAETLDGEVGESEEAEDEADEESPEPGAASRVEEGRADDERDDEGDRPEQ